MKRKVFYYDDPVTDEFSGVGPRRHVEVGADFRFVRDNIFWRIARFFVYRVVLWPFAALFCFFRFRLKIVGREKLREFRKTGYYLYGNHTQIPGDAFIHNMVCRPKDAYVVVNPDNIAMRGTKNLIMMLGAIPTPTTLGGFKGFNAAIERRIAEGHCVVVYPEAHIWPYYTGIRPFPATSFRYPAASGTPSFCFTVTYRCSAHGRPRIVTYVDGPFYGNGDNIRAKQNDLREQIYGAMSARAAMPENYAFYDYLPRGTEKKDRELQDAALTDKN